MWSPVLPLPRSVVHTAPSVKSPCTHTHTCTHAATTLASALTHQAHDTASRQDAPQCFPQRQPCGGPCLPRSAQHSLAPRRAARGSPAVPHHPTAPHTVTAPIPADPRAPGGQGSVCPRLGPMPATQQARRGGATDEHEGQGPTRAAAGPSLAKFLQTAPRDGDYARIPATVTYPSSSKLAWLDT